MSPSTLKEPYVVLDQPNSMRRPLKVICAGAGVTGLYLAYQMQRRMRNVELTIFEKNPEIGGTWYENRYPGAACDVPSHIYTYTFRPYADWTSYYAGSAELLEYFKVFRDEFDLGKYIILNTKITQAVWDESEAIWKVDVEKANGVTETHWAHVFINAIGILSKGAWPDIPNRESFQGEISHSAFWNESIDWTGKKVALIGTGSSAIQITPVVQKGAEHLTIFIRSPTWLYPQLGGLISTSMDPAREGNTPVNEVLLRGANPLTFTEEDKELFRKNPDMHLLLRKKMEALLCGNVEGVRIGTSLQKEVEDFLRARMKEALASSEELQEKFIPKFPSGCRRLTPGHGYLEALQQPNVSHVFSTITEFTPKGMKTADGKEHEFDVIICATGFDVAFTPHIRIVGRNGVSIQESWKEEPHCYLGIAAPGFPNYFVSLGPRGPWGNGSIIPAMEINADYFISMMEKMQTQNIKSFEVSQEATDDFIEHSEIWHKGSVWGAECRSWYKKNRDPTSTPYLWCGMSPSYYKTMRSPRYEDYNYVNRNANRFAYLGNGKIEADYMPMGMDRMLAMTTYIRNQDEPWALDRDGLPMKPGH